MKQLKYLLFTLILLINISIYSQSDSIKQPIQISETERIVDKYSEKITVALQSLAKSLEVPAQKVFEILIKQQYVFAITHTIIIILTTCFMIWIWITFNNLYKKTDEDEYICIGIVIQIIHLIYVFAVLTPVVGCYINPEYYALKDIIELIN